MKSLDLVFERTSERATPLLVKEIRAALRGKWFKIALGASLGAATLATLGFAAWSMLRNEEPNGIAYAGLMFACLTLGTHLVLPFSALLSMQAESDEHTLELLQLSSLAPWRIVLGKITSVLVQSGVLYGALLPFLTVAFLLRGVAIESIALGVVVSFVYCAALCSIACFLGSFGRSRLVRVLAMAGFGLFLLQSVQMAAVFAFAAFGAGVSAFGTSPFVASFALTLIVLYGAALSYALACARIAHAEENRSTPMRLVVSATILVGIVWAVAMRDADAAFAPLVTALAFAGLPLGIAASEEERLPRAVRVPKRRILAWFCVPWLPGGGRGVLFLLVHLLVPLCALAAITLATGDRWIRLYQLAIACLFGAIYVLVPSAVFAPFARTVAHRIGMRVSMGVFAILTMIVGGIGSTAPATASTRFLSAALAPYLLATSITSSGRIVQMGAFLTVLAVLVIALIANAPRVVRGVREVLAHGVRA